MYLSESIGIFKPNTDEERITASKGSVATLPIYVSSMLTSKLFWCNPQTPNQKPKSQKLEQPKFN